MNPSATPGEHDFVEELMREIGRLGALIREYAIERHWKAGAPPGDHCTCDGCELLENGLGEYPAPKS